ncbi:MAG: helix-turn-helix domain-containing protein [Mongoliitalea sp.]
MESTVHQHFKIAVDTLLNDKKAASKKEIAEKIGMSPSYFSELLKNRINLSAEHIQKFCIYYLVDPWFIFGETKDIFASTPIAKPQKPLVNDSNFETSPPRKSGNVSPTLAKNVSPTVSPTPTICQNCEEKERLIDALQEVIEAQRMALQAQQTALDLLSPAEKKKAG